MNILLSEHAKERMAVRGITIEQITKAIKMGATTKQTDGYESHYTYYSVCWKKMGNFFKIKTIKIK